MNELDSIFIAQNCSSAQQISSLLKQRNPIKETDKNTYKTALLIEQMIEEGKRVQNKANLQFIITMIVALLTLFFSALPYFPQIKQIFIGF